MKLAGALQVICLRGHSFLPGLLTSRSTVIDLGANHGEFSQRIRARFGCRCIAVEANPQLAHAISSIPGVECYRYAICDRDGASLTFHVSGQSEASSLFDIPKERNDHTVTVRSTTLQSLLTEAAVEHVDLLKVDIEGAEMQMFAATSNETLRRIDQITVEFHDFCGYVTVAQIKALRQRLDAAGFSGYRYDLDNKNWLFVKRRVASSWRRLYAGHLLSHVRRALHRLRLAVGTRVVGLADE